MPKSSLPIRTVVVYEEVIGFDIAMDDESVVRGGEAHHGLNRGMHGLAGRQSASSPRPSDSPRAVQRRYRARRHEDLEIRRRRGYSGD